MNKKQFLIAAVSGSLLLGTATFLTLTSGNVNKPGIENETLQQQIQESSTEKNQHKTGSEDLYTPQYKDSNGVCGLAKNEHGFIVAVTTDGTCPTNEELSTNYGYKYISLTDAFRPDEQAGGCGTAYLVTKDMRIGSKDMAKLEAMLNENLTDVPVSLSGDRCPTQAELSDIITNSIGVPVRFEYNNFNANPNAYPVLQVKGEDYLSGIEILPEQDRSVAATQSGTRETSVNGKPIPKILLTPESKEVCENNYSGKCIFDDKKMTLENKDTKKIYETYTHNGYVLPKFMMTKGAWDACGGIFSQCDFIPDDNSPTKRGTVTNNITKQSYTSPEVNELVPEGTSADDTLEDHSKTMPED